VPHFDRVLRDVLAERFAQFPVVTLTGPRQSGKTTLCREVFDQLPYVNLEAPDVRDFAMTDPRGFLGTVPDGAVLDEIQRAPELTSYLQVLVDERARPGQFVLTGSQQLTISEQTSQSLAGRAALLRLLPLSFEEAPAMSDTDVALYSGFLPRIHEQSLDPTTALASYVETYVERDVRQLTAVHDLTTFQRYVRLCAGRVGQLLNFQQLGNDAGVSHTTASNWMSILEASYLTFRLPPYHANVSKRLVKTPKLFFYDVGLAAYLLGIRDASQVATHPLRGALFENLVVVEFLKYHWGRGRRPDIYFYRDSDGNEVDLLAVDGARLRAIEIKSAKTIDSAFFKAFRTLGKVIPDTPIDAMLVYDGEFEGARQGAHVCRPQALAGALEP
jgi:uncharacterized protein